MILLDTHVVIWLALEPERISRPASKAIEKARQEGSGLAVCWDTLYEIARGVVRGRVQIIDPLEVFLENIESLFVVKPMTIPIAIKAAQMPSFYPSDPIDRVIGATALIEGIPLITADQRILESKAVHTIW
jgi:PIN domain nuclease of toxin-antitoxin system